MTRICWRMFLHVFAVAAGVTSAYAQDQSFKDKTITIVVGFAPGGAPNGLGRAVAETMPKYLPGRPAMIVRNMPGAEGVMAMNTVVAQAKGDGLTIMIGAGGNFDPLMNRDAHAIYDPSKLKYIGGLSVAGSAMIINRDAIPRLTDPNAAPVIMGASNQLRTTMWGVVLGGELLNWNVRWVFGYPGTLDMMLALTKGEIDTTTVSDQNFLRTSVESGKFAIYFQTSTLLGERADRPELAGAPTFMELAKHKTLTAVQQGALDYWANLVRVGSFMALVPETPESIVAVYREAFHKVAHDPAFVDLTKALFPDGEEVAGDELARIAANLSATSPAVLDHLGQMQAGIRK